VEKARVSLKPILDAFARTPAVQELPQRLPARGAALRLGGLSGSSGAVLAAWLLQTFPQRLVAIAAPSPVDAERWLTDLSHLTDAATELYPQREALGEDEPHYEIAGERAETIQALLEGRLRVLVTTARATAERTLLPAAFGVAARSGHKIYDCLYLALALERHEPLATADKRLAALARSLNIKTQLIGPEP
jgi:transcription-repair coupling factor (superfamily II helicase)